MRLFLLFMLLGILHSTASVSQTRRFSLNEKNISIRELMVQIENQSEFRFFYEENKLNVDERLTINLLNSTIEEVLNELFSKSSIEYKMLDNNFVVLKSKDTDNRNYFNTAQQHKTVTGKVTDSSGTPLPGVTVAVKGNSRGSITDLEGRFSIINVDSEQTLVFSFVGMQTKEIPVADQTIFNVTLDESTVGLEEVVAIGYGTMKKSDLTGAVISVKAEDIKGLPVRSVTEALQGRVAGVMINKSSGKPGSAAQIIIRGVGSINGLDPLFIIDGVAQSNSTNFNPQDVAAIEIIKDASAAAIYGAKAAGGVILITTKKGSFNQKTSFEFSARTGVRQIGKSYQMLEKDDYIRAKRGLGENYALWDNEDLPNTNWFDHLFSSGLEHSYLLSMKGGSEKVSYYLSGGYEREEGIQKDNYWERYSLRFNSDYRINKRLTVGHQLYLTKVMQDPSTVEIPWRTLPYMAVYKDDGSFAAVPGGVEFSGGNPVAELAYQHYKSRDLSLNGILYANLEITGGLDFRLTASGDFDTGYDDNFREANNLTRTPTKESYTKSSLYSEAYTLTTTLTYARVFGEKHDFKLMAGYEIKNSHTSDLSATASDFPVDVAESFDLSTNASKTASGALGDGRFLSQFGRLNYAFDNKYLMTANIRRDGSPKFGPENRWGVFPSLSAGWKITEENFFKALNLPVFNMIKPRFSWGLLGNDSALGNFTYQPSYQLVTAHSFDENNIVGGFNSIKVINEAIKWEEIRTTDVGLDLLMFNNNLTVTADYYRRDTRDMIYNMTIPLSSGIGDLNRTPNSMPVNIGSIINKGWELSVSYRAKAGDLNYRIAGNISHNTNEVIDLGLPTAYIYSGGEWPLSSNSSPFKTVNGEPVGQLYGFIADGLIQSQAEIDALNQAATAHAGTATFYNHKYSGAGDLKFRDMDGDHKITAADRTFLGNPWPDYQYGMNLFLEWKGFDFSADVVGIAGRDVMNDVRAFEQNFQQDYQSTSDIFGASFFLGNGLTDQPRLGLEDPAGSGAFIKDPGKNYTYYSSYFVEDGSYLKVKNMALGYTVSGMWLNKLKLEKLRIYLSGQNLLTFTKFSGLDPEFSNNVKNHGQYNRATYPQTRLVSFGLELGF